MSRVHLPVTALGWGRRIGIWVQGCSIGCSGCIAVDTWRPDDDRAIEISVLLEWVRAVDSSQIDGVTVSGGEPFEQAEALDELLEGLHDWRATTGRDIDILGYSGMSETRIRAEYWSTASKLDALIPEPFVMEALGRDALRGSSNQRIVPLSALGEARYTGEENLTELARQREQVQVLFDGESMWTVGIPFTPDLRSMATTVREHVRLRRAR